MKPASRLTRVALVALFTGGFASAQSTVRVSVNPGGAQANSDSAFPSLSADGRFVAFASFATNLVSGDTNGWTDVFVRDTQNSATERVSLSTAGLQGDFNSEFPSISADGRYVAFESWASNMVPNDTNFWDDVFVRDRQTGITERVSVATNGAQGNWNSDHASISADGRFVAFASVASSLVAGDTNGFQDVFVHDRQTGATELVSVDAAGAQGNSSSYWPMISADGRFVAFASLATNFVAGDTNGHGDIFVRDRQNGTTERVALGPSGAQGNGDSDAPSISGDGRYVAFQSNASNLVAGDSNGVLDIFVCDRQSGTTERVSVDSSGTQGNGASSAPYYSCAISADGQVVAFPSVATNLVAGDTNAAEDVFVHDRQGGATSRASVSTAGAQGNGISTAVAISSTGRYVAFHSGATNLVASDTNAVYDAFLRDRGSSAPPAFCFGDGSGGTCPCSNVGLAGRGCENSSATGGAALSAVGVSSISSDSFVLTSSGEPPTASSLFLQSSSAASAAFFGDGLRCLGGTPLRLYVHAGSGGAASAPQAGELSISARSTSLGDVIAQGSTRYYQVHYRDPVLGFCPPPQGNSWNISSGLAVVWTQ